MILVGMMALASATFLQTIIVSYDLSWVCLAWMLLSRYCCSRLSY